MNARRRTQRILTVLAVLCAVVLGTAGTASARPTECWAYDHAIHLDAKLAAAAANHDQWDRFKFYMDLMHSDAEMGAAAGC